MVTSASTSAAKPPTSKDGSVPEVRLYDTDEIGPYIGSIDQGTSSTRFVLVSKKAVLIASAQMEHTQIYDPQHPGYHEHDPMVLWHNTVSCINAVVKAMEEKKAQAAGKKGGSGKVETPLIAAIGITNQRETTIAWNKITGRPYYNAIVWDDTRTADIAASIATHDVDQFLSKTTGLPPSSYFAGTKVRWLLENVDTLRNDVIEHPDQVCIGTVDTWLLYQLTGHVPKSTKSGRKLKGNKKHNVYNVGGKFQTDVTNASRWLFMNLQTCAWDEKCITAVLGPNLSLPISCLPEICPSAYQFGTIADCGVHNSLVGTCPITSMIGDQQSALLGQAAFTPGSAKNTYGTGLFLMVNTGTVPVPSTHGLLTTVAYQLFQKDAPVYYALEGSVSHGGATIQWLRDGLQMISSAAESETLARRTRHNEGCYLVPAFAGLFAPHWRPDARGCLVGLTAAHTKHHVCRAALEAMCYQSYEVFGAMQKDNIDGGMKLTSLKVDGGGTHNELLMQFQADILQVPVVRPKVMETTALGAAFLAGLTIGYWQSVEEITALWAVDRTFTPRMDETERQTNLTGWAKAVTKSLGWVDVGGGGAAAAEVATVVTSTTTTTQKQDDAPPAAATVQQSPRGIIVTDNNDAAPSPVVVASAASVEPISPHSVVKKHVSFANREVEIMPPPTPATTTTTTHWAMVTTAVSTVALVAGIVLGRGMSSRK
jgi:glycerol kinase